MEKVGILGSAVVGQTLAQGFKAHGYEVRIGSRSPAKLASFTESSGVPAGTLEAVAAWGELLVLAVQGTGAEAALSLAGVDSHRGKIVIDTTNPITPDPPVDGVIKYFTGPNSSLLEQLQAAFPDTRLVKAFNSVGSARMVNPVVRRRAADDVLLRERCGGQGQGRGYPEAVRLGSGRHGNGSGGAGDRASVPALVHPGIPRESLDPRLQIALGLSSVLLDEDAVRRLLRMEDLIPAMERALADLSAGQVVQPVRLMLPVAEHKGFFATMPACTGKRWGPSWSPSIPAIKAFPPITR